MSPFAENMPEVSAQRLISINTIDRDLFMFSLSRSLTSACYEVPCHPWPWQMTGRSRRDSRKLLLCPEQTTLNRNTSGSCHNWQHTHIRIQGQRSKRRMTITKFGHCDIPWPHIVKVRCQFLNPFFCFSYKFNLSLVVISTLYLYHVFNALLMIYIDHRLNWHSIGSDVHLDLWLSSISKNIEIRIKLGLAGLFCFQKFGPVSLFALIVLGLWKPFRL